MVQDYYANENMTIDVKKKYWKKILLLLILQNNMAKMLVEKNFTIVTIVEPNLKLPNLNFCSVF